MSGRADPQQYGYESNKFTKLQNQVEEVKDVMKDNIDQILRRGEKLEDLADKSSNLESTAIQFSVSSKKIKRKMWWKNTKMTIVIVIVILVILCAIILALVLKFGGKSKTTTTTTTSTTTHVPPRLLFT